MRWANRNLQLSLTALLACGLSAGFQSFANDNVPASHVTLASFLQPPADSWLRAPGEGQGGYSSTEEYPQSWMNGDAAGESAPTWYTAHGQATVVIQAHGLFRSPYVGPHSLLPDEPAATSMTGTLFLDGMLWQDGGDSSDLVFNPEIAGGRGLSNVNGIAGFPNGEIPRVGSPSPTPYFARLFVRRVWGFGGDTEEVADGPNQYPGSRDVDRLTVVVGKMAATDFVDNNRYNHDPRTQFLPWSMMYNGAWDYPANVRGYTYGYGLDYNRANWAFRYGAFAMPSEANGAPIDPHFLKANGQVLELERRFQLFNRPCALRLLAYANRALMGSYALSLAEMPVDPDITATRAYRTKYGCGANFEQELSDDLGFWLRLGWNDGHTESFTFTTIDRVVAVGLLLQGTRWARPQDTVGLGFAASGLALSHRQYLAAGGLDFIIGDGQLNYGWEETLNLFYNLELTRGMQVTTDFQGVNNPAYNRDRGPVGIMALRVHIDF